MNPIDYLKDRLETLKEDHGDVLEQTQKYTDLLKDIENDILEYETAIYLLEGNKDV